MRRIAILNQKGGVGKTTTAVNLSAGLADLGRRVCLIDLDSQAHATTHFGQDSAVNEPSIYDVLVTGRDLRDVRRAVSPMLSLVGSHIDLAAAELELAGAHGRESILREAMNRDLEPFDYVIMDCAPSLGVLTLNALSAADEVIIPLQPHFLALHGLGKLLETTGLVARRLNSPLVVSGVVLCMYESATRLAHEVVRDLTEFLDKCRGQIVPWRNARLFDARIRRNIKLAECPSFGKSIFEYAGNCPGAMDYRALCAEVVAMEAGQEIRRVA